MNRIANRIMVLMIASLVSVNALAQKLDSSLRDAAKDGKTWEVQRLLREGASINSPDKKGQTALMLAAEKGHTDVVTILLEKGAKIDAIDSKGESALDKAKKKMRLEVIRILEFAQAKKENTISGYEAFLSKHPDGALAQSAKQYIAQLKIEEARMKAFSKAKTDNTVQAYVAFIENHGALEYIEKIEDRSIMNEVKNTLLFKKMANANFDQASSMLVDFVKDNGDVIKTKYRESIKNILDILSAKSEESVSDATLSKMDLLGNIYGKEESYETLVLSEILFVVTAKQQKESSERFFESGFNNISRNMSNFIPTMRKVNELKTLNFARILLLLKNTKEVDAKLRGWKAVERVLGSLDLNKLKEKDQKEVVSMSLDSLVRDIDIKYSDLKTTLTKLENAEKDEKVKTYAHKVLSLLK